MRLLCTLASILGLLPALSTADGPPKYFHEPGGSQELSHYDTRYFKGSVSYDEHRVSLRELIRSYLSVLSDRGVETWLAHGTLLGWWWNGQIMPWDYDLDVQVSTTTLYYMGQTLNRTEHYWQYVDQKSGQEFNKTYLLDINPNHVQITRGNGKNIIDARWIDMTNGMYVDITGLAERDKEDKPGIWSCKNHHNYRIRDLYPMRETEYEGVSALVPYEFEQILADEYGMKSLVMTEWQKHKWEEDKKDWIKIQPKE